MTKKLQEKGIPVVQTRTNDELLTPSIRNNRIQKPFKENTILISNHINNEQTEEINLIYSIHQTQELPNKIEKNLRNHNQEIGRIYKKKLPTNPNEDYYEIQRNNKNIESLIIEYGIPSTRAIDEESIQSEYREQIDMILDGLLEYIDYVPTQNTYIVQSGDTLWNIAKKYHITVQQLKETNRLKNNTLKIGQSLIVPDKKELEYTIKSGDNLYSIAKKYQIDLEKLMKVNNLSSNLLNIGETIKIPYKNTYIVENNDTLYSIANKFQITIEILKRQNQLTSNTIQVGQELTI